MHLKVKYKFSHKLILILTLFALQVFSQSFTQDTSKAFLYLKNGEKLNKNYSDSAKYYWEKAQIILENLYKNEKYFSKRKTIEVSYIKVLDLLADRYSTENKNEKGLALYRELENIYSRNNDKSGLSISYHGIAFILSHTGKIPECIEYYKKSVELKTELKKWGEAGTSAINIAYNLNQIGDVKNSIEWYEKAIDYFKKETKNEKQSETGLSQVYNNLAIIYKSEGDSVKPLELHKSSMAIKEKNKDVKGMAISLINIGVLYYDNKKYKESIEYYDKAIQLLEPLNDYKNLASAYSNKSESCIKIKDTIAALSSEQKALEIRKKTNDKIGLCSTYNNISNRLIRSKNYDQALSVSLEHLKLATEINLPAQIKNACDKLKTIYYELGDYPKALEYYELNIKMRDSINNEQNQSAALKSIAKYEFEKKEALLKVEFDKQQAVSEALLLNQSIKIEQNQRNTILLEKNNEIKRLTISESQQAIIQKQIELENQENQIKLLNQRKVIEETENKLREESLRQQKFIRRMVMYFAIAACLLLTLTLIAFNKNKKLNKIISEQRNQTQFQKKTLEEKQKEILDSIRYAQRIQKSLLPIEKNLAKTLQRLKN